MLSVYVLIFAIILASIIVIPVFGGFGKKKKSNGSKYNNAVSLDRRQIQSKWSEIEATANLGGPAQIKA